MVNLMGRLMITGGGCFVAGMVLATGLSSLMASGGGRFDPARPSDVVELRRLVYSLSPVVNSLRLEQISGQGLPKELDGLSGLPSHFVESFPKLSYIKDGDTFRLYYKLGWDPSLEYDSRLDVWSYDPGDGASPTVIAQ